LEYTGVDGVMVSEAILGNPTLFVGTQLDPLVIAEEYLQLAKQFPHGLKAVRPHLYKFLHRELSYHTNIRDLFAQCTNEEVYYIPDKIRKEQLKILTVDSDSDEGKEEKKLITLESTYKDLPNWYNRYSTYQNTPKANTEQVETEIETDGICFLFGDGDDNKEES